MNISFSTPYLFEQHRTANSFTQRGNFAHVQDHTTAVDTVQFSGHTGKTPTLTPIVLTLDDPNDMATAAARFESLHGLLQEHFPNDLITQLKRYVDEYKADPALAEKDYEYFKDELDEWFKTNATKEEYQQFKQADKTNIPIEELAAFKILKDYTPEYVLSPQLPSSPDTLIAIPNPHQENSYLGMTLLKRYGGKHSKTGMILNACVDKPWRGQGVFKQMITMAEREAKQQGITHTFLGAYKDYGLVDWYKKQGYEVMTKDSVLPEELAEQWKTVQKEKPDNEVYLIKKL